MSILIFKKSIEQTREFVLIHRRELFRQSWPALGILFVIPIAFAGGASTHPSTLSHVDGTSLQVMYSSLARLHEATVLEVRVMNPFGNKSTFSIRVGKDLLNKFSIVQVNPEPLSVRNGMKEAIYLFSGVSSSTVSFTLMPIAVGNTSNTLQFGIDPPIGFAINVLR